MKRVELNTHIATSLLNTQDLKMIQQDTNIYVVIRYIKGGKII